MASRTVVLAYHAVGPAPARTKLGATFIPTAEFERQMEYLARRRRVMPLADLVAGFDEGPRGEEGAHGDGPVRVAITFDDGYRSVLENAAPVLERHGFPATMFVPTAWIGDRNRWDGEDHPELDLMTADELMELGSRGFEIASHGHRHVDMSRVGLDEARADVDASVEELSRMLGKPPRHLSYPYGRSSDAVRDLVSERGFAEAFALEWEDRPFARSRTPVFPADSGWRFALKSSGRYAPLRRSLPVRAAYAPLRRLRRGPSPERRASDRAR